MNIRGFLRSVDFALPDKEIKELKKQASEIKSKLADSLGSRAEIFIGGSFAKDTMIAGNEYDVDIFVRFGANEKDISGILEKAVKKTGRRYEKVHGSRDYFRIDNGKVSFEIIPVIKIKNPKEAQNVTDLSYFHVKYIRRKLNSRLKKEIRLAKKFCKAQGVCGAESYVQGFSGYGLECLIIYYGSFEKMMRELSKDADKIIIDPERYFKNKKDITIELNESRTSGPIVLVDPTWKERNVLAGLNNESFSKFKEAAGRFMKKPGKEFFERKEINAGEMIKEAKRKNAEFLQISMETNKQEGDIAGTKMKKFSRFLREELSKFFEIIEEEFSYDLDKRAEYYVIARKKKEIIKKGPPVKMEESVSAFKKKNKDFFVKEGMVYARVRSTESAAEFLRKWIENHPETAKQMSITDLKIT